MQKNVEIFTDGSCLGNPGPGGYGTLLRYKGHEKVVETFIRHGADVNSRGMHHVSGV